MTSSDSLRVVKSGVMVMRPSGLCVVVGQTSRLHGAREALLDALLRSLDGFVSTTRTVDPARATTSAIPAPIVPPPITRHSSSANHS